jgi:hypothetical protein
MIIAIDGLAGSPSPLLRGEGRGEGQLQIETLDIGPPLTLTLSPLKSGERGFGPQP